MEDNEIIKAFECCNDNYSCPADCPLYEDDRDCLSALNKPVLDLINRKNAEIERLCMELDEVIIAKDLLFDEAEALIKKNKAEAVKEFAERLKEKQQTFIGHDYACKFIYLIEIDNLVKEMVGEG